MDIKNLVHKESKCAESSYQHKIWCQKKVAGLAGTIFEYTSSQNFNMK